MPVNTSIPADKPHQAVPRQVISCRGNGFSVTERELVEEVFYEIYVNGEQVDDITCSPWDIQDAVIGGLYLKGLLHSPEEIRSMEIFDDTQKILVCIESGSIPQEAPDQVVSLTPETVIALSRRLEDESHLFHRTGGVHSAVLARDGEFLIRREDVSRHMTIDKAVGACLQKGISLPGLVLVFSGRVASEIAKKAAAIGCSAIIARSAPTDYACQIAEQAGITLIGFARDDNFNIYTCPQRVTLAETQ